MGSLNGEKKKKNGSHYGAITLSLHSTPVTLCVPASQNGEKGNYGENC